MAKESVANRPFDESDENNSLPVTQAEAKRMVELAFFDKGGEVQTISATAEDLRQMSFTELVSTFGGSVTDVTQAIGTDQFGPILQNKERLIGVPFLMVKWNFYSGDIGNFVSIWVLTEDEQRYIVNDGSTGIYEQLRATTDKYGIDGMVTCKHGLRVSEYEYEDDKGQSHPAKTFYLDTKL